MNDNERIINEYSLDNIKVMPYRNVNNQLFVDALKCSDIGYYELHLNKEILYITDVVYNHFMVNSDFMGSYGELMRFNVDHKNIANRIGKFIEDLLLCQAKSDYIELRLNDKIKNNGRYVKFHGKLVFDENQNKIVVGTIQNLMDDQLLIDKKKDMVLLYESILDSMPNPIIIVDDHNTIEYLNNSAKTFYEIEPKALLDKPINHYIERWREKYTVFKEEVIEAKDDYLKYQVCAERDGLALYLNIEKFNFVCKGDDVIKNIIIHTDMTDSVLSLNKVTKLLKANELSVEVKDLLESIDDLSVIFEYIIKKIKYVIPNADSSCFLKIDAANNLTIASGVGYNNDYSNNFKIPFETSFACERLNGNYNKSISISNIQNHLTGDFPDIDVHNRGFVLNSNITSPISIDGKLFGILSIDSEKEHAFDEVDLNLMDYIRNQVERSIMSHWKNKKVVKSSQTDYLTGLYNRRYFHLQFQKYIEMARMNEEQFSFVVVDIDNMKRINDKHGHLVGDSILKRFADFALANIREEDVFSRYGGDEFVGLFRNSNLNDMNKKIIKWKSSIPESLYIFENQALKFEFSYGISVYPSDGTNFEELMEVADKRMYVQKNKNR